MLTGSTGFIGKNLLAGLSGDYDIYAPARQQLNMLDADAVLQCLRDGKYDVVIHSATQNSTRNSKDPPDVFLERTLRMFFNLLRSEEYFSRMLYFGSGAEFDKSRDIKTVKEEGFGKRIPQDPYGLAKYIMAETAKRREKIYNLRMFGCYGPHEDWEIRFISNAICKALYNVPITMRQNVFFDYMYVMDLVPVVRWFIDGNPKYHDYNVCSGKRTDLIYIVSCIEQAAGKKLDVSIAENGLNREYTGDNSRLAEEMTGFHITPIEEGVKLMYSWYSDRIDTIQREKLLADK